MKNKGQFKKGGKPWNKGRQWLKEKKCGGCGETKPREAFMGNQKNKKPYHRCKKCRAKYQREWRKKHPENFKKAKRKCNLKKNFGITVEEYDNLFKRQNGKCGICGVNPSEKRRLAVDHCHETGRIRGLLCDKCNRGIGQLGDTIDDLKNAINYLLK